MIRIILIGVMAMLIPLNAQSNKELERQKNNIFKLLYRDFDFPKLIDVEASKDVIKEVKKIKKLDDSKSDDYVVKALFSVAWPPFQNAILISHQYAGTWERHESLLRKKTGESFIFIKIDQYYLCIEGQIDAVGKLKILKTYLSIDHTVPSKF